MAANYNCLLLDIDGTLLDFASAERQAIRGTLLAFGLPADEETAALYSAINRDVWHQLEKGSIKKERLATQRFVRLLEELGAKGEAAKLNADFTARLADMADMLPGADEALAELAEFATLAAISNGLYKVAMKRLEKSGLLSYFDDVFISEKVGAAKPSPRIFNQALNRLGVKNKEKVLVVGDSLTADIKGGQNAGLDTCWCNFTDAENTLGINPTHTVHSYTQLKLVAVGEEELKHAANREKRHIV